MGVIQRQGIKQSLVNYFAVIIGAVSTLFIYPLETETYGLARFVIDTSIFFAPFILMGLTNLTIRFFPTFKEEKNHNGFLFFLVSGLCISSIFFALGAFIFKEQLIGLYADKAPIYRQFLPHLVPLSILIAFFTLFYMYCSNFKRIVVPSLYQNLIRVTLPVLVLLFYLEKINIEHLVNGIILTYVIAVVGIIAYVIWLGEFKVKPDFSLFTPERKKEMRVYAMYGLVGGFGTMIAFRIDSIMISTMLDFSNNGIYAIAAFIANVIAIPTGAIMQISAPIISSSFKEKNLKHISQLYQQSSINLLVIGFFLFICIIISVNDLFSIMPKGDQLQGGFYIVLFIGLGKVIDMGTSINNHIINYSEYFRFNFYAIVLMGIFNVIANFIFIPIYGIVGVAMASFAAVTLYNITKMFYVYRKFKMQPFTMQTVKLLLIGVVCFLIGNYLPSVDMAIVDILIRSIVVGLLYGVAIYYFKISKEINEMADGFLQKIKRS